VLLHEAAHIKRSDSLTQTIAQIICALYWFNPLMWMTARCLLVEREQACDDIVLAAGIRPSAYAVDLLELSQLFHQMHNASLSALTFVRPSQLYMRLQAVINSTQNRRVVTKHRAVLMWGAALGVVYPIGSITLQPKIQHQKIQPSFGTEIVIPHIPCCTLPSGENNFHQLYDSREMQQMKALPYTALTAATLAAVTPASKHVPHITTSIAAHSIVDAATPKKVAGVDTIGDNADTSGQETTGDYVDIVSDNDQIIEHVPGGTRFSFKPSEQLVVTVHGDPLTIVDGIPSRETSKSLFKHFDPKKIKTVDVLSIAESIKRYGDAAKKGAIVVTTFK
jgi:hypothetical protein